MMQTDFLEYPLSLRDLARLLRSVPRLGQLPPRDHECLLLPRFVFQCDAVTPGTVYWDLSETGTCDAVHPDIAFFRGALGVVSPRPSEPWAGRFSLQIHDEEWSRHIARVIATHQLQAAARLQEPCPPAEPALR